MKPSPPRATGELDIATFRRAQGGDESACRQLILTYEARVAAAVNRILGPHGNTWVEDLAQETFLRAFRALPSFDPDGSARLSTWILTIASRLAIQQAQRRPPSSEPLERAREVPADGGRADVGIERAYVAALVNRAVADLPVDFRAVFVLRAAEGLEYREIARMLEVDVGTVRSRLSRARAALRAALGKALNDE